MFSLECLSQYSITAFYNHPFGVAKNSLKRQVVCETKVAKTCSCKIGMFLLLKFEAEGIFLMVVRSLAAVYTDILHLCCLKFIQKVVSSLHKPTTRYMCTLLWSQYSGTCAWKLLCVCKIWQSLVTLAGSHSPQRRFCTKSSLHRISVIKTRWSLTTEIINSSFYCT